MKKQSCKSVKIMCQFWGIVVGDAEKAMATHSSVLAWRIPGTGEPGGLLSVGSHRVGHNWSDLAAAAAAVGDGIPGHWRGAVGRRATLVWGGGWTCSVHPRKKLDLIFPIIGAEEEMDRLLPQNLPENNHNIVSDPCRTLEGREPCLPNNWRENWVWSESGTCWAGQGFA